MPAFGPCRRACGCAGLFFFAGGLRCPVCLRRIALCPVFLSVFRLSLAGPHLPLPVSPSVRFSLCPCFSQPASPQLCRFVLRRLYSVWFFFCHFLFFRSSSIARRLLSVAHCLSLAARRLSLAACCPSLAACCPSLVAPFIVHRPPLVGGCPYPVARRAAPHLFPLPFGPDHGFCIRGIPACVSAGAACRVVPQRVPSVGLSAKMRPPSVPWSPRRF